MFTASATREYDFFAPGHSGPWNHQANSYFQAQWKYEMSFIGDSS